MQMLNVPLVFSMIIITLILKKNQNWIFSISGVHQEIVMAAVSQVTDKLFQGVFKPLTVLGRIWAKLLCSLPFGGSLAAQMH